MLQTLHGSAPGNEKSLQGLLPNIASNIEKKKLIRSWFAQIYLILQPRFDNDLFKDF